MPETPIEKPLNEQAEADELAKDDSWEKDQEKRGYYYDDAHGYEVYVPEEADEDEETRATS